MKIRNISLICLSLLMLSACDMFDTDMTGQVIRFGASSGSGLLTRTEYSGKQSDGRELISWKTDGSDDVTIHMFWNGAGGDVGEVKDYYVSNAYVTEDKSICKGNLSPMAESLLWKGDFSGGDGRAHEYKHSFYSVYPANSATFKKVEKQFEFELKESLSGVDMSKAYMAAGLENVTSENSPVLQYYPMITTLYVTLVNDTDNPIIPGDIVLRSTDKPICGKYTVQFNATAKKFAFQSASEEKKTVTINVPNELQSKEKTDIAFFIIPQEYDPSTLLFEINGKEHNFGDSYTSNLVGANKYNITVYLSEKEPDIEEPEIEPPVIDDALAQLIFAVVRTFEESKFLELFKDFIDEHYYQDKPNYDLDFWHDFFDAFSTESDGAYGRLTSFLGDNLNDFLDVLGNVEELDVSEGYDITSKKLVLGKEFGKIFSNVKRVYAQINNDITFEIDSLNSLESFEITGGSNGHINLAIKDCPNFTDFTISADGVYPDSLSLVRTPKFESGYVNNQNLNNSSIYLEDCSTGVQSAHIRFANQNLRPTVKREGNTKNVIVECGYYDVDWSQWPPIYGDWHTTWTNSM